MQILAAKLEDSISGGARTNCASIGKPAPAAAGEEWLEGDGRGRRRRHGRALAPSPRAYQTYRDQHRWIVHLVVVVRTSGSKKLHLTDAP